MITLEELKARPLSYSSLKEFKKSPLHFLHYRQSKFVPSEAMLMGSLIDCLILTPDRFDSQFVVMPVINRRTNAGKDEYAKFLEENKGRTIVDEEQVNEAKVISAAVFTNPVSKALLDRTTKTQTKYQWTDKKTGLPLICYLDGEGEDLVTELKSCQNADPEVFAKDAANMDYPLQCGTYLEAIKVARYEFPDFHYIAVEKKAPYGVSVQRAGEDYVKYGKQQLRHLLDNFKYCMDNNLWHQGYEFKASANTEGKFSIDLPGWLKPKLQD